MKRVCLIIAALSIMMMCASTAMAAEAAIEDDSNKEEYRRIVETATDREIDELCRVLFLECRGESFDGKVACVETIFNRVLSEGWPDTVHGVLSQKGQFATYRRIDQAYEVDETDIEVAQNEICRAVMYVYKNGRTVLPSEKYVYFDTKGINGSRHIRVGNQYFGKER